MANGFRGNGDGNITCGEVRERKAKGNIPGVVMSAREVAGLPHTACVFTSKRLRSIPLILVHNFVN